MKEAILLSESIRANRGSYGIIKYYENGIAIGKVTGDRIAVHRHLLLKNTVALHPVVGEFPDDHPGWIFPDLPGQYLHLDEWLRELRLTPPYHWHQLLKHHVETVPSVKVAIEDYSLGDLNILVERGWYMGRSAHAPLWRIYGSIPEARFEKRLPALDGQLRTMDRFGAIYDPRCHKLEWKLKT